MRRCKINQPYAESAYLRRHEFRISLNGTVPLSFSFPRIWDETRKPRTQWRCDNARSFTRYIHSQVRGLNSRLREARHRERDSSSSSSPSLFYINYSSCIFPPRRIDRGEKSCAILNYARLFPSRNPGLQPVATVFDYRAGTIFLLSLMVDAAAQIRMTEGGCRDSSTKYRSH